MNFILFFIFPIALTQNATVPSVTNVTVPATQIGMILKKEISKPDVPPEVGNVIS